MSHYTKNVQSLLTGGFKVLNVILKSKFSVEDKTKELCFFDYFYRRFSQKYLWCEAQSAHFHTYIFHNEWFDY